MSARLHVGDLEGDRLIASDGASESLARVGVGDALVHASLGRTHGEGRDGDTALVENLKKVGVPTATFAEEILTGDTQILKRQGVSIRGVPAHLVVRRVNDKAVGGHLHQD